MWRGRKLPKWCLLLQVDRTVQLWYGPKACGTDEISPNDVSWSNCNAKAECGRYAKSAGQKFPLNICFSEFGFCGAAADFYKVTDDKETSCQSNFDVLTHIYFSFGYITPGDFKVVSMDDLPTELFTEFTNIKKHNAGLKTVVALGGWTFNNNGTVTQPVFSNMVSTAANRKLFMGNLFGFMRKHGFDGVDFDWEYPRAGYRGGQPEDSKNFVTFLKELDDVNNEQPEKYVDDSETFKQETDFANEQDLFGLLIWAIDQDTQDLEALKGVVAPKDLKSFARKAEKEAFCDHYELEHLLELQMVAIFRNQTNTELGKIFPGFRPNAGSKT
ncbi:hypothetical protein EYC80_002323 [Monilinia laxa]|uniref:chitinase n=1 Tax=Monilinia laxa TaxID=61186 RepID=A0A5N6K448_MONLA|nr:hypothetical protein EYC80_002323 [Monilinia laxa]